MNATNPILYPSVTSLPGGASSERTGKLRPGEKPDGEFDRILRESTELGGEDLGFVKKPLKFSAHATQRLNSRNIELDPEVMARVSNAVDLADSKGIQDSLILTDDAAFIVSVKNRTVVTAMDRDSVAGNVFTNIDGAVIA